ncbi:hypothetical protein PM082_008417 [Marasmius tenuissimus]|nr:hypothetical protein PM082_008417 [Marasmius tenuissimus]
MLLEYVQKMLASRPAIGFLFTPFSDIFTLMLGWSQKYPFNPTWQGHCYRRRPVLAFEELSMLLKVIDSLALLSEAFRRRSPPHRRVTVRRDG